jgi:hypothetical protein
MKITGVKGDARGITQRHRHAAGERDGASRYDLSPGVRRETHVMTYAVTGVSKGPWTNCAKMTSPAFFGTLTACATRHPLKPAFEVSAGTRRPASALGQETRSATSRRVPAVGHGVTAKQ